MCIAQNWPLLHKGQLYKQMLQPSINSELYSEKSYAFNRKLFIKHQQLQEEAKLHLDQRKREPDLERKIASAG